MPRNLLFICAMNRLRSPTAEAIFCECDGIEVDSAGLNRGADVVLSAEQLEWADLVLVMEKMHKRKLNEKYGEHLKGKKVVVLNIPDDYEFMEDSLVNILRQKCANYL